MRRINDRALPEPIPFQMGLQVPCCIRAQTAAKSHLRSDTPTSGTDFPWAGAAKGMPDSRRASDAGACAHVHRHSPQAPGGFGDRVSQREERHCDCPAVRQGTELDRKSTRLNSSHSQISYAVFCLKKKKKYIK